MSYVKFEARSLGDDRWLDVTPQAFTLHVFALSYCNEQATDGRLRDAVARRLVCPVEPADVPATWEVLVRAGFWVREEGGYRCPSFLAHGIAAEEQNATRNRWAEVKRRQRLHNIGNHQLCQAQYCKAKAEELSTHGHVDTSTRGQVDDPTRPNSTRPDQTPEGSGAGRRRTPREARGGGAPTSVDRRCPHGVHRGASIEGQCVECWPEDEEDRSPAEQAELRERRALAVAR